MAFTARGFDGVAFQFNEDSWSKYQRRALDAGWRHFVDSGGDVTPGTGRAVNVSVIDAIVPGVWFTTDAVASVALTANGGAQSRIDYVVAEVNWATNDVSFRAVAGVAAANPQAPSLTQTAGVLWQMPLARVTVAGNATTISAAGVEVCKPVRQADVTYRDATFTARTLNGSSVAQQVASVSRSDPGWPYRVRVNAAQVVATAISTASDFGYVSLFALVGGSEVGRGRTSEVPGNSGKHLVSFDATTDVRTGPVSVTLSAAATGMSVVTDAVDGSNRLEVTIIPA